MKRQMILLLALLLALSACGAASGEDATTDSAEAAAESGQRQVDMLYYLDLGDGSIMAACCTEEGISGMGEDYYVVHTDNAAIYDAAGRQIALEELTRGVPVRIAWDGIVMMSEPGQINARTVTALSDEPDPSVPPEDQIEPVDGGNKWWEPTPVTEVPDLGIEYSSSLFSAYMRVEKHTGSWRYADGTEDGDLGGAVNAVLDGLDPQQWTYDDSHTLRRTDFDEVRLSFSPEAQSVTVTAYAYGDTEDRGQDVALGADGTLALLDGAYIYVVCARWDREDCAGNGVYGFLVTARE